MRPWLLALSLAVLPGLALAQIEPGDPGAGKQLAATWCANCHRIAPSGPGPATDIAPSFAAIAAQHGIGQRLGGRHRDVQAALALGKARCPAERHDVTHHRFDRGQRH
jgi:mono/diheme cytochrome c family protein